MMAENRMDDSVRHERPRRRLVKVAGIALSIVAFGATGLSGTLAQQDDDAVSVSGGASVFDDVFAGGVFDEDFVSNILEEVFGSVASEDDSDVSGGGDINVGGNVGGNITMGGSSGGGITVGSGVDSDG